MMVNAWIVIALTPTTVALARELLGLYRYALRRASIERVVAATVLPGSHVVDRDDNGALFELTIEPCLPTHKRDKQDDGGA
jgi:hypothetical protein